MTRPLPDLGATDFFGNALGTTSTLTDPASALTGTGGPVGTTGTAGISGSTTTADTIGLTDTIGLSGTTTAVSPGTAAVSPGTAALDVTGVLGPAVATGTATTAVATGAGTGTAGAPQEPSDGPVFVDETGRRSRKLRKLGWVLAAACAVYAVTLVAAVIGGSSAAPWLLIPGPAEERKADTAEVVPAPSASEEPRQEPVTVPGTRAPGDSADVIVPQPGRSASRDGAAVPERDGADRPGTASSGKASPPAGVDPAPPVTSPSEGNPAEPPPVVPPDPGPEPAPDPVASTTPEEPVPPAEDSGGQAMAAKGTQ